MYLPTFMLFPFFLFPPWSFKILYHLCLNNYYFYLFIFYLTFKSSLLAILSFVFFCLRMPLFLIFFPKKSSAHVDANINKKVRSSYINIWLSILQSKKNYRQRGTLHYIIMKGSIWQEDTTIINVCIPNNRASKYINKSDRAERNNGEIHNYTCGLYHLLPRTKKQIESLDIKLNKDTISTTYSINSNYYICTHIYE